MGTINKASQVANYFCMFIIAIRFCINVNAQTC
ncbi:hypothetical protein EV690_2638 [Celerinatantimonas diazotrophica]|uniref:Uncharacterized protein n=1 Tax=Celerinatantimonas diazotrophica TaxID=412034 RepID=A0A4V2PNM3_9GAMM|nr:hypothetical protein EV690_2638 [Celerinatantimonas diazotrophica]CAG9296776.1 hypothetical protein CEDIAZO_01933 [Celerinatantimonas diazotrophica]